MKSFISTSKAPKATGTVCQATIANGLLFTSAIMPLNPETGEMSLNVNEQTIQVLENLKAIVEEAGASFEDVLKCTVYLLNWEDFGKFNTAYSTYFKEGSTARACYEISKMPKGVLVEVEAIVAIND